MKYFIRASPFHRIPWEGVTRQLRGSYCIALHMLTTGHYCYGISDLHSMIDSMWSVRLPYDVANLRLSPSSPPLPFHLHHYLHSQYAWPHNESNEPIFVIYFSVLKFCEIDGKMHYICRLSWERNLPVIRI